MIKFENTQVVGWEPAIRGMRNPMNSWEKSDTTFIDDLGEGHDIFHSQFPCHFGNHPGGIDLGENDHDLMMKLASNGPVHAKYRRMIVVYVDVTAPLYWWKEFDTYKVGTVANSCSTMHKIQAKEFTFEDFSCEHLLSADDTSDEEWDNAFDRNDERALLDKYCAQFDPLDGFETCYPKDYLIWTICMLNRARDLYLKTKDKKYWWQMIQLLPSSYNQRRTVMLNYEVLAHIYPDRKNHKLDEWHEFCRWIEQLPYSELITGIEPKDLSGTDTNLN